MTDVLPDVAAVYAATRERFSALVRDLDLDAAEAPVPACPAWRVKDVVAHVTGVCADILAGRIEGVATDPWTQAQVDARRDTPIADVVDEWTEAGKQVEAMLGAFPPAAANQLVFDAVTHEHDVRAAIGAPGARDSEAVALVSEFAAGVLGGGLRSRGLPAVRVRAGDFEAVVGEGQPEATVTFPDRFELLRACTGRRTADELRGLAWEGDADRFVPAFESGPFKLAAASVGDGPEARAT